MSPPPHSLIFSASFQPNLPHAHPFILHLWPQHLLVLISRLLSAQNPRVKAVKSLAAFVSCASWLTKLDVSTNDLRNLGCAIVCSAVAHSANELAHLSLANNDLTGAHRDDFLIDYSAAETEAIDVDRGESAVQKKRETHVLAPACCFQARTYRDAMLCDAGGADGFSYVSARRQEGSWTGSLPSPALHEVRQRRSLVPGTCAAKTSRCLHSISRSSLLQCDDTFTVLSVSCYAISVLISASTDIGYAATRCGGDTSSESPSRGDLGLSDEGVSQYQVKTYVGSGMGVWAYGGNESANSHTRNRLPGTICTENAVSCIRFRGAGHVAANLPAHPQRVSEQPRRPRVTSSICLPYSYSLSSATDLPYHPFLCDLSSCTICLLDTTYLPYHPTLSDLSSYAIRLPISTLSADPNLPISLHYLPTLSAYAICLRYLPTLSAYAICLRYLPTLPASCIFLRYISIASVNIFSKAIWLLYLSIYTIFLHCLSRLSFYAMSLHELYAVSGTDIAYGPTALDLSNNARRVGLPVRP
eukprot:2118975-Rhodomonas_salina.2